MKLLPNMKLCKVHGMYPSRFDKCPECHHDAKSKPLILTTEQLKKATKKSIDRGDLDESQVIK